MQDIINIKNKSSERNTGDSSKKLGTDTGRSSSTPHSEGHKEGKKIRAVVNAATASYMGQINIDKKYCKTLGAQDERTKQEYAAWDKNKHH